GSRASMFASRGAGLDPRSPAGRSVGTPRAGWSQIWHFVAPCATLSRGSVVPAWIDPSRPEAAPRRRLLGMRAARWIACLALLALAVAPVRLAAESTPIEVGLITGGERGTYYQFGLDLQKLVRQSGINLTVYPSKGSVENIYAVYQRPATQ